jgi:hypothetical protein
MKKPMMSTFRGKESKSEEGKEKRMAPAAYKRGEMSEKAHGYKAGGFKPCAGCKTAAKCAKAGKCMGKK